MTDMRGKTCGPDLWERTVDRGNCIEYTGHIMRSGHGHYGGRWPAHRVAFERYYGWLPKLPQCVMHLCHNPACVNPLHLAVGTRSENIIASVHEGHFLKKLTHEQVFSIRQDTRSQTAIAAEYGVHPSLISRIKRGERHGRV